MADIFAGVPAFVAVAAAGSFRAAGERLSITPAAVSKAVSRLEDDLGVRLFVRTTRQVRLSAEGAVFLPQARAALKSIHAGREAVALFSGAVQGPLAVTLSPVLGRFFTQNLSGFLARYPDVALEVRLSDRLSRLVEDRVDVAVRIGPLSDSSLVQKHLFDTRWVTAASPRYWAERGRPTTVQELAGHRCLKYISPRGVPVEWSFVLEGRVERPKLPSRVGIDQGDLVVQAARDGLGVCQAMDIMVDEDLRRGSLQEVLADHAAAGPPIHALCLPAQRRSPRVRALFDYLGGVFAALRARKNAVTV